MTSQHPQMNFECRARAFEIVQRGQPKNKNAPRAFAHASCIFGFQHRRRCEPSAGYHSLAASVLFGLPCITPSSGNEHTRADVEVDAEAIKSGAGENEGA